jgi:cysteine desulfurase/selenocysteine lyase
LVDWKKIRQDFPTLDRKIDGKPIIYFDNACMALKPKPVIDAMNYYYSNLGACAGRSIHSLAQETNDLRDEAREKIANHINAKSTNEIIWVRNTTEAVNIVAHSYPFEKGDEIVSTSLEHHSGILPFHRVSQQKGLSLKIINPSKEGIFDIEDFENTITDKTRLISIVHNSNVTGSTTPLDEIIKIAHDHNAVVFSDEAQYFPHHKMDVQHSSVDFCGVSMHKALGPTGIGFLFGKEQLLKEMDSFLVGGDTISDVKYSDGEIRPLYLPPPMKFEAGLQNYASEIGAGAAVDYLNSIGFDAIEAREKRLTKILVQVIEDIPSIEIIGPKNYLSRGPLVSFQIKGLPTALDIANFLDSDLDNVKIMIRAGAHCTNPFHYYLGIQPSQGTARASLYFYNTQEEIQQLENALTQLVDFVS